ncbi:MAG: hypothetical protein H7326_06415 [Bdellovibrionaceae bacterium]|nr:hypothetical protein [Pseudobdellovibrionaceae bacterium]
MRKFLIRIASMTVLNLGFSISLTSSALADNFGTGARDFENRIQTYQKFCSQGCKNPFSETAAFEFTEADKSKLDSATRANLERVAFDQAQVWGDTILEGDYVAEGKTQLDHVFAIYESGKFLGYKISYSEQAWFVGECDYNYHDSTTLKGCTSGRIHESSFVSPDFETYFRDETDLADFQGSKD